MPLKKILFVKNAITLNMLHKWRFILTVVRILWSTFAWMAACVSCWMLDTLPLG